MKLLTGLLERAEGTLEEIEWYGEKAMHYKTEHKNIADTYNKIADMHITIYEMLHKQMVDLIEEYKHAGSTSSLEMVAIWEYEHEKLIKKFSEAKTLVEEYKKTY